MPDDNDICGAARARSWPTAVPSRRTSRGCTAPLAADSHTAFADGLVRASEFRFRVRRAFVCNSHFEAHAQLSYLNLSLRLTHPDVHWLRLGAYLAWRRGGGRVCHQTSSWATPSPCTPCQPLARSLAHPLLVSF